MKPQIPESNQETILAMATAEGKARYPDILRQDWEALGYVGLPAERLFVRLEGEIHDLFQYHLDGKPMITWSNQLPEQYLTVSNVLDPVFRLATNILLSPASLDWFYYLIYSPRTRTDPPIQHNGDDVYVYRRDDTLMETRHEMARAALQRLAMTHTIALEDVDEDEHNDEGRTEPRIDFFEQGINIKNDLSATSGIRAHIIMSRAFVRDLMDMCMEGSRSYTEMQVMRLKMAIAFIHEVAVSRVLTPWFQCWLFPTVLSCAYKAVKAGLSSRLACSSYLCISVWC